MIMVDELVAYAQPPTAGARYFGQGRSSCHLTTDGELAAIHAFAARLGLQRRWCQHPADPRRAHYDLTPAKRVQALRQGAVFVPAREQAQRRLQRAADESGDSPGPKPQEQRR